MSKQENKQTVLESIYAFDASTAVMESIMNEGEVQFGVQNNDDDDDLITTADGDEVFNPAHLMDMKISDPAESGPRFNDEIEPMTEDDKKFYVDRFAEEMMNLHKSVVSASDIEGIGAYIQMTSDTRHDVVGFLQDEIAQAEQRLTAQNTSEALPSGVSADMTGDGVEYTSEEGANIDAQMGAAGDMGDIDIGAGEVGLNEIEPTAHLTPNADDGMSDPIDIGVDEDGAEPASEESDPFGFEDDDNSVNPFDDLNMGDENGDADGDADGAEPASEDGNEKAENGDDGTEPEEPSEEGGEQDDSAETEAPADDGDEDDAPDFGEPEDDDAVEPFTESAGSTATFESVMAKINQLYKERCIKSKCDAIVEAANREIRTKAMMESGYGPDDTIGDICKSAINPSDNVADVPTEYGNNEDENDATLMECGDEMSAEFECGNDCDELGLCEGGSDVPEGTINPEARHSEIKAQCESIVEAYKKATARNTIKTQLESIVADYQNKVNREKSVKAQCESIIADYAAKTNGSTNIKAKVESIIRKYRASK